MQNGIYTTFVKDNEADDVCNGQYIQEYGKGFEHIDHSQKITLGANTSDKMVLGKETFIDGRTVWRVKLAQWNRYFSFFGVLFFIAGWSIRNDGIQIIAIVCCCLGSVHCCVAYKTYRL